MRIVEVARSQIETWLHLGPWLLRCDLRSYLRHLPKDLQWPGWTEADHVDHSVQVGRLFGKPWLGDLNLYVSLQFLRSECFLAELPDSGRF